VITGEVLTGRNQRKFIPVLRIEPWQRSAPSWLKGKYYIDLSGSAYAEEEYEKLLGTLLGSRPQAPPVGGQSASRPVTGQDKVPSLPASVTSAFQPISIEGVIVDEVSSPRNDGTPGSALYEVPFRLSRVPPGEWREFFVRSWDSPPRFTTMHRPGIASVIGDTIILDGTTLEEVEDDHRETLILAVQQANRLYAEHEARVRHEEELERQRLEEHKRTVADAAKRIRFDT